MLLLFLPFSSAQLRLSFRLTLCSCNLQTVESLEYLINIHHIINVIELISKQSLNLLTVMGFKEIWFTQKEREKLKVHLTCAHMRGLDPGGIEPPTGGLNPRPSVCKTDALPLRQGPGCSRCTILSTLIPYGPFPPSPLHSFSYPRMQGPSLHLP